MTGAWQAMPDFVDGTAVDEGDFDPIVSNVTLLRQSGRVIGGRILNSAGGVTSGTTELNIGGLAIPSLSILNGGVYVFGIQLYGTFSAASNGFALRVRQNVALTGTVIVTYIIESVAALDQSTTCMVPWKSTSTATMSFFVSVQRLVGAGTLTVGGGNATAHWIEQAGDEASSVWAIT